MAKKLIKPDYLFETSWEVCNKIGGIHTVISTKATTLKKELGDNYITIGPDVLREDGDNPEFTEDFELYKGWREQALADGLKIKIGRWNIAGEPVAVLVDFSDSFIDKDTVFSKYWEIYKLDSLSGQWDYIEPALFGHTVGEVIESFVKYNTSRNDKTVAHFHEWMTGTGVLYLKHYLPQVASIFTTHATVVGRSLAGNHRPLYSNIKQYNGDEVAKELNITSKQSLEKLAAREADSFTTVSEITAKECSQFLQKSVDIVTPNGFEDSFVPSPDEFEEKRKDARKSLLKVAEALLDEKLPEDTFLTATSGRYEFKNKGIDLYINALGKLNNDCKQNKTVVAFVLVPAHHYGPRKDLLNALEGNGTIIENKFSTHNLHEPDWDPTLNQIKKAGLKNEKTDKVKIIFVPSYLNGDDGIFNKAYYDLLIGLDSTVFVSYYEPWGYTPLESLAFYVPTITTTLAGFGMWVKADFKEPVKGITVIDRNDNNDQEVVDNLVKSLCSLYSYDEKETAVARNSAFEVSRIALWKNLIEYYKEAYTIAIDRALERSDMFVEIEEKQTEQRIEYIPPQYNQPIWKRVIVQSYLPEKLKKLDELTQNMWWTWNDEAQELFEEIDSEIWNETDQNPLYLFERVSFKRLTELANNSNYTNKLDRVYDKFKTYLSTPLREDSPKIAYFSMEYGLHDFLKIYSGGLGVLAGDYMKEASDSRIDITGVGFLYRYGYFKQILSVYGEQMATYDYQHFSKLPIKPFRDEKGEFKTITVAFPGRTVFVRVWEVKIGRISLYLLDTDFEANRDEDRYITHHLYGGDNENRLKQEIILGIGGIRTLEALGIEPELYHSNEGHSAFISLERLRKFIIEKNFTFAEAREIVRSSTLFTTHTPVPAGHDEFDENLLRKYMSHYPSRLNLSWNEFMSLGRANANDWQEKFNMSHLACHLAQEVNGVSLLHGQVSREMFAKLWPGYAPNEIHIGHVTNGVHYPTWTAAEWKALYKKYLGEDIEIKQTDKSYWEKIYNVPDKEIWDIRESLRSKLITVIKDRFKENWIKRHEDPKQIVAINHTLDDKVLTIGFARRFATYKRAHLLFRNIEKLAELVNDPERPIQFLFAGKAHPADKAGQDLIKMIVDISKRPEFLGKILFLQNYDMQLAKHLVRGVDIWLNTPTRPLEASGTSGEKSVMNGGLHFSVLDGWWVEGYQPDAGWALTNERTYDHQGFQDDLDAETIYSILENEVTPAFYNKNKDGYSPEWVQFIKNSIAHVVPKFTMTRMIDDYMDRYYTKLHERTIKMRENDFELAKKLSTWKRHIAHKWDQIEVIDIVLPERHTEIIQMGKEYDASVVLDLKDIPPKYMGVELVFNQNDKLIETKEFDFEKSQNGHAYFSSKLTMNIPGTFSYGIRLFPKHQTLAHRQDIGFLKWI